MDTDVANIVLKLKYSYPMITLECAIPCETQAVKWNERDRDIYYDLLKNVIRKFCCSKIILPTVCRKGTSIWLITLIMLLRSGMVNRVVPEIRLSMLKRKTR